VKLLRTIRLDASDSFIFDKAAEPGEWAVSGAFTFACLDPAKLRGRARGAFRAGFLELASLGHSTLVQSVEVRESDRGIAVYSGDDLDDAACARLIGLFRLTFRDPADVIEHVRGDAVYLLLATTTDVLLRMKPQNLVAGLPIQRVEAVN
jgi:hypothetical protein